VKGNAVKQLLLRLIRNDQGQDLIEYAFLAIFVALAVTVGLGAIGGSLDTGYSNIGTQVSGGS
jgi:pilus assembly protein Flp/PilA